MGDISGGLGSIGGGISDLFQASGDKMDASSLDDAANMEDVNAKIAAASGQIQTAAAQRDLFKVGGQQQQAIATGGFTESGSALDIARDTASQGSITMALIGAQTSIDVQGYEVQAAQDRAQSASDRNAAKGAGIGGILGIATGVLGLFGL